MATKAHHRKRHSRRLRHVRKTLRGQWLLILLAHTLATIVVMVAAKWLHLPVPGGE
jgi:hypothetical protein